MENVVKVLGLLATVSPTVAIFIISLLGLSVALSAIRFASRALKHIDGEADQ